MPLSKVKMYSRTHGNHETDSWGEKGKLQGVLNVNQKFQAEIHDIQRKRFWKELLLFCILCLKQQGKVNQKQALYGGMHNKTDKGKVFGVDIKSEPPLKRKTHKAH